MDKYEYKVRSEEISKLIDKEKYAEAVKIADTIDWRRVKSAAMLLKIAALYRISRRNEDSREMLMLAYERYPTNRSVVYSLCELSIELDDVVAAIEYYKQFVKLAPKDNGVYTLRYRILETQEASLEERIEILEELKKKDYQEEWAYELAYLYHRVGLSTKCVEECDDIILWFGDGPYVMKAMELKAKHVPLTPMQQQNYDIMLANAGQNYSNGNYVGQNYDAEGYDGQNYDAEGYTEQDYNAEGYTEQDYNAEGYAEQDYNIDGYAEQNYDSEGYTEQNYNAEGYTEQDYNADGYAQQDYNADGYVQQGYNVDGYVQQGYNAEGYTEQNYDNGGYAEQNYDNGGYTEQNYDNGGYTEQDYAGQNYDTQNYNNENYDTQDYSTVNYNEQNYGESGYGTENDSNASYANGYEQEDYSNGQYADGNYSQQNDADGQYAQNSYVDDGYGNLSYVDDSYQDNSYTSEFYVEQTYDESGNLISPEMYTDNDYTQDSYGYSQEESNQTGTSKEYRNGLHVVENPAPSAGNSGDMSQYNTINLQKVVAESMKELFPDDNEDVFAEDREKYNSGADIGNSEGDTRIFASITSRNATKEKTDGATDSQPQTGRMNIAQMVTGVSEKAPEPHTGAIKKVFVPGDDARSIKSDSDIEELRDTTEQSVDDEHIRMEHNDENVYHEHSIIGEDETEEKTKTTGPMNLDEVLVEWERMKQDNAKKNQEKIKKRVLTQTGKIFADFDHSIKSGILGELEREEEEAERSNQEDSISRKENSVDHKRKSDDGFLDADVTGDILPQSVSEDDFDIEYVTEHKKKSPKVQEIMKTEQSSQTVELELVQENETDLEEEQSLDSEQLEPEVSDIAGEQIPEEEMLLESDQNATENDATNEDIETAYETKEEVVTATSENADHRDSESAPYTEEEYAESTGEYNGEVYAEDNDQYSVEEYTEDMGEYTGEIYVENTDEYIEEVYPDGDTEEPYAEDASELTKETYVEDPEEYTGESYAENAGEYTEEILTEDTDALYAEDDGYDQEDTGGYADTPYMENNDDLEDAYSEPEIESRHVDRRRSYQPDYQYNENDIDPEDAESIAEMAKEDALKTQEIKMNTADLSALSERIVATTKKEASGAKREEIRDFTQEEQTLFENFAVTRKIKKQIIYALENMTLAAYTGNVIITGDAGLDTVRMAKNLVKVYQASDEGFSGRLAKITGEKINQRNIKDIFEKLHNGGIIIEKANGMSEEKLYELATNLNQDTLGIVVIMEDTKKEITKLLEKQAMIVDYFNIRIDLMEMDNNALVAYAKNYALALEYSIDELGTLALYTRIANMQSGNHVVTKDEVRDIIDEAIWKSKKSKIKNFVDVLFARRYDNEDMIVLKERDFM